MKTTISLLVILFFLISPVAAEINITADNIGTTFVTWSWNEGINITGMWIDGYRLCAYDTDTPYVDIVDLSSCVPHNFTITTLTDSGINNTMTLCGVSQWRSVEVKDDDYSMPFIMAAMAALVIGVVIIGGRMR